MCLQGIDFKYKDTHMCEAKYHEKMKYFAHVNHRKPGVEMYQAIKEVRTRRTTGH